MLSINYFLIGQDFKAIENDYNKFKKIYGKRVNKIENSGTKDTLNYYPIEQLPAWLSRVYNPEQAFLSASFPITNDSLRILSGQSNALIIYAILNRSIFIDFYDLFVNEYNNETLSSKFKNIIEFNAYLSFNHSDLVQLKQKNTRYQEEISMFRLSNNHKNTDSLWLTGFLFFNEYGQGENYHDEYIIDYHVEFYENQRLKYVSQYKNITNGKMSDIQFRFDTVKYKVPQVYYRYFIDRDVDLAKGKKSRLYYGFYNGMITNLLFNLTTGTTGNNFVISSLNNNYSNKKYNELIREIQKYPNKAEIIQFMIDGDYLKSNIKYTKP